jgi:hypothetical protein
MHVDHYHPEGWQKPKDLVMGVPENNTNPVTSAENKENPVMSAVPAQQPEPTCPTCGGSRDYSISEIGVCSNGWHLLHGQQPEDAELAAILQPLHTCKRYLEGDETLVCDCYVAAAYAGLTAWADRRADKRVEEAREYPAWTYPLSDKHLEYLLWLFRQVGQLERAGSGFTPEEALKHFKEWPGRIRRANRMEPATHHPKGGSND